MAVKGAAPEITILKRSQFFYYLYSLFSTGANKVSSIVFFQRENNNFFSREKSNLVFFCTWSTDKERKSLPPAPTFHDKDDDEEDDVDDEDEDELMMMMMKMKIW